MDAESTILDLVGLIYDAAGHPERWSAFLERLGKLLNAEANTILVQDIAQHEGNPITCVGIDPAFQASYAAYYDARNVYYIHGRHLLRPGVVCPSDQLCSPAIARKSEFHNDWMRPQGYAHGLNAVILQENTLTSIIGVIRCLNSPAFLEADYLLLKTLMPHLQRAVQLQHRITSLQNERNAAFDALNRWPLGVILVNAKGQVLLANQAAEAILNEKDGLFLDRGELRAARPAETAALRKLILGAIRTSGCNGIRPGGALVLPRPSLKRSLKLLVTPACANTALFVEPGAAAAVFVSDPETVTEPNTDCLARLYNLTPAESMLALLLMQGKSTEEAAEELNITKNAVRFHLKHVFSKTGTRRQGELVRLLLTGPAQLRLS